MSSTRPRSPTPRWSSTSSIPSKPKPFRRRQRSTYVTIIHALPELPEDVLKYEYPLMVRGLANLGMLVVPGHSCHFVTPERGVYSIPDPGELEQWVRDIVDRITPLATSRLVIDNRFEPDLEPELWQGDDLTESLFQAGKRLDALGLLPAPFPLHEIVPERELRRSSASTASAASPTATSRCARTRAVLDERVGVDKSNLRQVGKDVLMVKDYEPSTGTMVLSVPPRSSPTASRWMRSSTG